MNARILKNMPFRTIGLTCLMVSACTGSHVHAQDCLFEQYDVLLPVHVAAGDQFGVAVAGTGNWLFVGAPGHEHTTNQSNPGAVFVFRFDGSRWVYWQELMQAGFPIAGEFGCALAADNDSLLIGAQGTAMNSQCAAYVYKFNGSQWVKSATFKPRERGDLRQFGSSVALQGNLAVVGVGSVHGEQVDGMGAVYVYRYIGNAWVEDSRLTADAPSPYDHFGASVAIHNKSVLVGAPDVDGDLGANIGAVFAFHHNGTQWAQQAKLQAPDAAAGDRFGWRISSDSGTLLVGAPLVDPAGPDSGAAYVFTWDGEFWTAAQKIVAFNETAGDQFGFAVHVRGMHMLIGAPQHKIVRENHAHERAGTAYLFQAAGGTWIHQRNLELYQAFNEMGLPPYACWLDGAPPWFLEGLSEARLGISAAFTDQHLIIGSALDRGYCPVNNWNLAHKGAVNIFQMVLEEADCDGDGSPDVCDAMPDCNGNGLPDSCDLQTKFSADCNGNALPDECDAIPLYQYDDEDCPGFFGDLLTPLSDLIWLNQFRVRPGGQMVTHIVLPTSAYVPEGAPVTLLLYSDPNHDGDPSDARLLRAVDSVRIGFPEQQSRYWQTVRVPIEPTFVGEPGEFFFVGAIARQPVAALYDWDWLPAFVSTSGPLKRSWIAAARFGEGDINHLANNEMPVQRIPSGVFFLRALAMDCNQNGVWDHCDIASGTSVDANHNDLPDECEGPDCLADAFPSAGDGLVDTSDLLYVIDHWGACLPCYAMCAGDINDDCAVNVIDLLAVINAWGACR